jgi:potassium/hydrogen antiporter
VLILFAGGMETNWPDVRPLLWRGLGLSTLGVFLTAVFVAWFLVVAFDWPWLQALLLGSLVSSTDAAAVFAVLRSRNASLKRPVKHLLELESGSNDPMAVFLTLGFIILIQNAGAHWTALVPMFVRQMALGALLGVCLGWGMVWLVNRLRLEYEGLYPVLTLSLVLLTYGITSALGGNGFLAAYMAGLVMGNKAFLHKKSLLRFHDGIAWLMQIAMFLALGLLVFPSQLIPVAGLGLAVSIFLMFFARPLGVFLTLVPSGANFREKLLVSWVGLRGAAPIILATFPLVAGVPLADTLFHIVFFIVITSVLFQGTTLPPLSRALRQDAPLTTRRIYPLEFEPTEGTKSELIEMQVPSHSAILGRPLVDVGLPKGSLIVLVSRANEFIVPRGDTVLESGDNILVLAEREQIDRVRSIVEGPAAGLPRR